MSAWVAPRRCAPTVHPARGISTALATTFVGAGIAIPAIAARNMQHGAQPDATA
jgi:hypothetical protein